jgi:predicted HAD superfamily Cof-like phosphohydrolase
MTLTELMRLVAEFHHAVGYTPQPGNAFFCQKMKTFWRDLVTEEYTELLAAIDSDDYVASVDAIGDLMYALLGASVVWRIPLDDVIQEIHKSNMTKVATSPPVQGSDGKIQKGDTYVPPKIRDLLMRHGLIEAD